MRKILYSALVLILIPAVSFISSCKKTAAVDGHIQSINSNGSIIQFTYDSQGRLSTYTDATNGTVSFSYSSNSVTVNDGGVATIFPLNNSGYATGNGGAVSYSYDNSGDWTTTVNGTTTTLYTYSGGDLSSVTSGNVTEETATYLTTRDYRNYGVYFLGKNGASFNNLSFFPLSMNLVNTAVANGANYQFIYTYDSKGRVATEEITGGGGATTTNIYTYTTN